MIYSYYIAMCSCNNVYICYLHLAWKLWKQFNLAEKDVTSDDEITENKTRPEQKEYLKKNKSKVAIYRHLIW